MDNFEEQKEIFITSYIDAFVKKDKKNIGAYGSILRRYFNIRRKDVSDRIQLELNKKNK